MVTVFDGFVSRVTLHDGGSGILHITVGDSPPLRFYFERAPEGIARLNGLTVWGSSEAVVLGHRRIAVRDGAHHIVFEADDAFRSAVDTYHARYGGY